MNAASTSYEESAGRYRAVTEVHERLCGTTGTTGTTAWGARPFTIEVGVSDIALERRGWDIHDVV